MQLTNLMDPVELTRQSDRHSLGVGRSKGPRLTPSRRPCARCRIRDGPVRDPARW